MTAVIVHVVVCFLIVGTIVLAAWQLSRRAVGWVIFDVAVAAILLALITWRPQ